ncbi:glycosyltransferase family 4 protein [Hymenobacter sp. BT559]|uniref:glycosyltransferase family 4 protein n=1 Tax=Hymenobacter sp. BT559 TaxID=2795729 RepID=UPI0018EA5358|nr:glycosyltransferase family 4 protein [Hymenobacter sp. BT559]MBJ6143774.1 glycosyltransferase family 4 protein [Hymenobacter sp. BT559]
MKLLLSAYACNPNHGSEEGNGFNWLWESAALGHEVWCLTTPRGRADLTKLLADRAADPVAQRIHPVYVAAPKFADFAYRWQIGVYLHYIVWQYRAWRAACQLDAQEDFGAVHHVTYNSLQMASWLWRLKKPLLLGPLGGGMVAPRSLRKYLPEWFKTETVRNVISSLLTAFDPNVRQSMRHAALVMAANSDTAALARRLGARKVALTMSAALPESFRATTYQPRPALAGRELRILWLARIYPRKGLHLTLAALGQVDKRVKFHLDIMGDGPVGDLVPGWIAEAGLQGHVTWHGSVPYETTRVAYLSHDLFMLCSLRDTYANQYLESMALGLPILTLDHHGAADFIPDTAGIKVPVQSAEATTAALARAVEYLYDHPAELEQMGRAGIDFAASYTRKKLVTGLYQQAAELAPELAGLAPQPKPVAVAAASV